METTRNKYIGKEFEKNIDSYRQKLKISLSTARGQENSKSRQELAEELGIGDRELRYLIADCVKTRKWPILSTSGGKGYFYPSKDPDRAKEELEAYYNENASRIRNLEPKCDMAAYWQEYLNTKEWW